MNICVEIKNIDCRMNETSRRIKWQKGKCVRDRRRSGKENTSREYMPMFRWSDNQIYSSRMSIHMLRINMYAGSNDYYSTVCRAVMSHLEARLVHTLSCLHELSAFSRIFYNIVIATVVVVAAAYVLVSAKWPPPSPMLLLQDN